MSRTLPPLSALRAFEAAGRHCSFTRAARELNVTQAAVSHQIRALEDHLGLPLFVRLTRGLVLTDAGESLLVAASQAFDGLADAVDRLNQRETVGALTVSTPPSFAAKWLVPRMSHFQDRHPTIELRIAASERQIDFASEDIDVGVRFGAGAWPGLRADLLAGEQVSPVCSPALASRLATPADLATAPLLHEEMRGISRFPQWRDWLDAAGAPEVEANRGVRFSHTHMMLQAAIDGHGVALGQRLLAADDLAVGRLVQPFSLALPTGYGYYLVCALRAANRPKVAAFRNWVFEEMAAQPTMRRRR